MGILLELFVVVVCWLAAARFAPKPARGWIVNALKAWVTVRAFWLLLEHPVALEDGTRVVAWELIVEQMRTLDAGTFWTWVLLATGVKFVGILASMYRWQLLLAGQRIELPFRHIFGSFLIGRFIGTFLPSTAGLDGYKLYDAARFSGRTVEATAATALEKVLGVTGIFLSFLVALPFGIKIFGEQAPAVAMITVPVSLAVIGGLLALLWFPGIVQWLLRSMPLPGKARLEGLVMRISRSTAAYADKKALAATALLLSFVVHFTTAAMYYCTAVAVGAGATAEFWPLVFGSSIQIFATVLAPTMGGVGAREWAQLVTLGHMIGPAAAIVSAALGFWAAEGLTLFGGVFWWVRGERYRPAYCRVDGRQVDYAEAARAASELLTPEEKRANVRGTSSVSPLPARMRLSARLGIGTGLVAGLVLGVAEAVVIARDGFGAEAQVLWYGPLAYAAVLAAAGAVAGAALSLLPMDEDETRGWVPSLVAVTTFLPLALAITLFRVKRDVFLEQAIALPWLLAILGTAAALALLLMIGGRRFFGGRAGALIRPLPALAAASLVIGGGALVSRMLVAAPASPAPAAGVPQALAEQPNVILVMVDTLRADFLSCYGGPAKAPQLCGLAESNGTRYQGFANASWTKPAAASLLTGSLPSSHGAMSKTSAVPSAAVLVSEAMRERGYVTGGIVSNINLAPSFGFDQGWDEYHYLAPDYLVVAEESSSKLVIYQIARKVWFRLVPGKRVGDYYQDSVAVNEKAFEWLDRNKDSRFFLFLHYMDPHDPYFAHPYDGEAIARVDADHPDPSLAERMRELYTGEIEYLDANFGALLARLQKLGVYDDTIIIVTADHGEEFYEHGGFWHGLTLYEEAIHIPLLIKWPAGKRAAPPLAEAQLARQIDVAPTILAQTGAEVPETMQGVDLTTPWAARTEKDRMHLAEEDHEGNVLRALRGLDWKYIEANDGNPRGLPSRELFRIDQDPAERDNVVDRHEQIASDLRTKADATALWAKSRAVESGPEAEIDLAAKERLRALGYVD